MTGFNLNEHFVSLSLYIGNARDIAAGIDESQGKINSRFLISHPES